MSFNLRIFVFIILIVIGCKVNTENALYPTEIIRLDSAMDLIVSKSAKIELISDGHQWTEGPLWVDQGQFLLFCDIPENKIYKWKEGEGVSTYLHPSGSNLKMPEKGNGANGLILDQEGRLLLCQERDRVVARMLAGLTNPKPNYASLTEEYQGKRLNSPNDLVMDQKGNIFFTDPPYGLPQQENDPAAELHFSGVYCLVPGEGLKLLAKGLRRPNGIGLSPDESTLYVANSDKSEPKWMAYELNEQHEVVEERLFFDASELVREAKVPQLPDGLTVAKNGTIFATGPDGVLVFTPSGKHLGTIRTLMKPSNCDLNEEETVLYVTTDDQVLRVIL